MTTHEWPPDAPAPVPASAVEPEPAPGPVPALRERLLSEATRLLATEGFRALTVRRIAEASGCSTIGVYTHFGGKAGLVEAVLSDAYGELRATVAAVDALPAGRAQLTAEAHAYRDWALANPDRYQIMFTAHGPGFTPGPATVERMEASLEDHRRRVADAIVAGAVHGDRAALAHQIWACVHGHVMLDIFLGRAADDEAVRSAFTVAFGRVLDGLAVRAER